MRKAATTCVGVAGLLFFRWAWSSLGDMYGLRASEADPRRGEPGKPEPGAASSQAGVALCKQGERGPCEAEGRLNAHWILSWDDGPPGRPTK